MVVLPLDKQVCIPIICEQKRKRRLRTRRESMKKNVKVTPETASFRNLPPRPEESSLFVRLAKVPDHSLQHSVWGELFGPFKWLEWPGIAILQAQSGIDRLSSWKSKRQDDVLEKVYRCTTIYLLQSWPGIMGHLPCWSEVCSSCRKNTATLGKYVGKNETTPEKRT